MITAREFAEGADRLVLDLRAAYDAPFAGRLERTFLFRRGGGGSLTVTDAFEYDRRRAFETALVTAGAWKLIEPGVLDIRWKDRAVRVTFAAEGGTLDLRAEPIEEDVRGIKPTRLGLAFSGPVVRGRIAVRIEPVQAAD